jgi:hypothetical protein
MSAVGRSEFAHDFAGGSEYVIQMADKCLDGLCLTVARPANQK